MSNKDFEFQARCRFNAYCKKAIRNRANELKRKNAKKWKNEHYLEELAPKDIEKLMEYDAGTEEKSTGYFVGGKLYSKEELHEAINHLPDKKGTVIYLYYFKGFNDGEIGKKLNHPRTTINYKKKTALKAIREYLEENKK